MPNCDFNKFALQLYRNHILAWVLHIFRTPFLMNTSGRLLLETPVLESLFNKFEGLMPATFIKNRLQHRWFSVSIAKFFRTAFFVEHLWWLLLKQTKKGILLFAVVST